MNRGEEEGKREREREREREGIWVRGLMILRDNSGSKSVSSTAAPDPGVPLSSTALHSAQQGTTFKKHGG